MGVTRLLKRPGNTERFREIACPHLTFLYNLAMKYTGNRYDAEDMVQETYFTALKSFHQLRDESRCKSWLFAILRNIYLREARQSGRMRLIPDIGDEPEYVEMLDEAANTPDVERALEQKLDAQQIQELLSRLPEKYKTLIILYFTEEMSYREISDLVEIPIGTVMSRLSRGKQLLKKAALKSSLRNSSAGNVVKLDSAKNW